MLAGLDSTKTNTIVLSNTSPFRPGSAVGKLSDYRYELLIQDKSVMKTKSYRFQIDSGAAGWPVQGRWLLRLLPE
ncbi:MAG: hypothetical protein WKG07_42950 [Hymenobacter sp.]